MHITIIKKNNLLKKERIKKTKEKHNNTARD
jgi:hypothetical protein